MDNIKLNLENVLAIFCAKLDDNLSLQYNSTNRKKSFNKKQFRDCIKNTLIEFIDIIKTNSFDIDLEYRLPNTKGAFLLHRFSEVDYKIKKLILKSLNII